MSNDNDKYTSSQREEYEAGQKAGSEVSAFGRALGPGFVSDEYQAGFVNGAANPSNHNFFGTKD